MTSIKLLFVSAPVAILTIFSMPYVYVL